VQPRYTHVVPCSKRRAHSSPALLLLRVHAQVYGPDALQHPYSYVLFLGQDARGDMIPCRQLRDKYGARRRDVYKPGSEPSNDADDEDSGDGGGGGGGSGPKDGGSSGGGSGKVIIPGIDMSSLDDT
jgi:uncharacterized membrane protein YgcG